MNNDFAAIFCPPFPEYKEQPADISQCELVDCPSCENKMWFSEKKKLMKKLYEDLGREVFFGCYDCFRKYMQKLKDSGELKKSNYIRVDI